MRDEPEFLIWLRTGYDRKSAVAAGMLGAVYLAIGVLWLDLLRQNLPEVNWLLVTLWAAMSALLCWRVRPKHDLALAAVSLLGGFAFEWWGTETQLWHYFTGETPPVWILPAWPVAALATARLSLCLSRPCSSLRLNWGIGYWTCVLLFAAGMIHFIWPSICQWPSIAACGCIGLVIATSKSHQADLCLFAAGAGLGFLLEYWGTTQECWTYYNSATPPLITAAAHGFAQLCYARVLGVFGMQAVFIVTTDQDTHHGPT